MLKKEEESTKRSVMMNILNIFKFNYIHFNDLLQRSMLLVNAMSLFWLNTMMSLLECFLQYLLYTVSSTDKKKKLLNSCYAEWIYNITIEIAA